MDAYRLWAVSPLVLAIAWIAFGWWRSRRFARMLRREQQARTQAMTPVIRELDYDALRDQVRATEAELARVQAERDEARRVNATLLRDLHAARQVIVKQDQAHMELQDFVLLVCGGWRQGMAVEMRGN